MGDTTIMKFTYLTKKITGATSSLSLWQEGVLGPWRLSQAEHKRPSYASGVKGRSLGDREAWDLPHGSFHPADTANILAQYEVTRAF